MVNKNPNHEKEIVALNRVKGQIQGVQKMIEERKYCVDILYQVQAVMGALARVEDGILERHLEHCMSKAIKGKSAIERHEKFNELISLIKKFRKL